MDCESVHVDLYRYIDGELAGVRRIRIRRHLRRCPDCEGGVAFQQRLRVVLRHSCRAEVPEGLEERVRRALEA